METDDLLLFVRVAELRSLTAAGRDLRLTPAVVSSRLIRLEKKLGMRLLNRTTRQVDLTPMGTTSCNIASTSLRRWIRRKASADHGEARDHPAS